jgi:hypothetical protein
MEGKIKIIIIKSAPACWRRGVMAGRMAGRAGGLLGPALTNSFSSLALRGIELFIIPVGTSGCAPREVE